MIIDSLTIRDINFERYHRIDHIEQGLCNFVDFCFVGDRGCDTCPYDKGLDNETFQEILKEASPKRVINEIKIIQLLN